LVPRMSAALAKLEAKQPNSNVKHHACRAATKLRQETLVLTMLALLTATECNEELRISPLQWVEERQKPAVQTRVASLKQRGAAANELTDTFITKKSHPA